uniref:Large ribosomal subunit protein uL3c n=1 Tax=Biomphalaria glabrata TaxID=6526 RepID=A0A2C9JR54_BIOGL
MKGLLGKKIGMTQIYSKTGKAIPVTVIEVTPNVVTQVKTLENDGYVATQLSFGDIRENLLTKSQKTHFAKANTTAKKYTREIRDMNGYNLGDNVTASIFQKGEMVDVASVSKGHGFSGPIKRHNQSTGPMGHGSGYHRGVGSMGSITNNRIFKGKNMPGQYGHDNTTVQNLQIVDFSEENNFVLLFQKKLHEDKELILLKLKLKLVAVERNHELKKVQVMLDKVLQEIRNEDMVELLLDQNQIEITH